MKRIFSLLLALMMFASLSLTAYAHDYVQMDRTDCSIHVVVRYQDDPIDSGTLTAMKVGYVDEDDGNYFFRQVFTDTLLEDVQTAEAVETLLEFYDEYEDDYNFQEQTVEIQEGVGKFENLSTGLYLIVQEKASNGYSKLNPFLVSVPYMQDGQYQYHVTANMKSELEQEPKPTEPTPEKLPQTGQLNWPVPILAVSGLALVILGWVLSFRRKKNEYEK